MKKTLKKLALCCLVTIIGVIIGSSSKRLLGATFSNVNSSPEAVVENYITASYMQDEKTIERCLSDDLNDMDKLEYLSLRGLKLASDNLELYKKSMNFKKNPPQDITKEELKVHNEIINKVEKMKFNEVYARSKVEQMKENMKGVEGIEDIELNVEEIKRDEDPFEDGLNKDYIGIRFRITQSYDEYNDESEYYTIIQEKSDKYYIVNIQKSWS